MKRATKRRTVGLPDRLTVAKKIVALLKGEYPDAHCELDFANPFQLLVATVLSAQTTSTRANPSMAGSS